MSILKVDELQSRTSGNRITLPDVNNYPPYRNLIINGDMSIAQRGTSVTGVIGNGYYTVDRMRTLTNLGTFTVSQSTDVPTGQGFSSSFKYDCTTAEAISAGSDRMVFEHRIEGQNVQQLKYGTSSAESLTLSFWVKSNKTGTYCLEFFNQDNSRQTTQLYTIDSSNTWEKKTITISGDTSQGFTNDNNFSLGIFWWLGAGTDYTSGTRQTTWSDRVDANRAVGQTVNLSDSTSNEWYITGVQLEVGDSATPFEHIPYDLSLKRCQRYYQLIKGFNGNGAGSNDKIQVSITYPIPMRASPTLGVLATGSGNGLLKFTNGSSDFNQSSFGTNDQARHNDAFFGLFTGFSVTNGNLYTRAFDDGDYLELDGEL